MKNLGMGKRIAGILAGGCIAAVLAVAGVQEASASSIKVIVNDQAITTMDIAGRAKLIQVANHLAPGPAAKQAQEELIDEALHIQEGKRRGITVPDDMVDRAIGEIAARSKLSPAQFGQALGQAGVPIRTLKDRIRGQMVWGRIVRAKLQQDIRSQKNDLIAQMRGKEKGGTEVTADDYVLQRVVFTVQKSASPAAVAIRQREAEALRTKFSSCADGIPMAKTLKEVAVINMGRRLATEVPEGFRDQLKDTAEGHLTKPDRTDLGFEMYAICEKIQVTGESAVTGGMDAEALSKQGEQVSKTLTQELRQRANIVYR